MKELELKYGCNPNQKPARIFMNDGKDLPIKVLSGRPGYTLQIFRMLIRWLIAYFVCQCIMS